jgi:hypothetical protein
MADGRRGTSLNPHGPFCNTNLSTHNIQAMNADHSSSPSSSSSSSLSVLSSTNRQSDHASTAESTLSLVAAESRLVGRAKMLVFFVLFVAAAACGVSAYMFAKQSELYEFRQQVRTTH